MTRKLQKAYKYVSVSVTAAEGHWPWCLVVTTSLICWMTANLSELRSLSSENETNNQKKKPRVALSRDQEHDYSSQRGEKRRLRG